MTLTQINKAGLDELALDHVFTIGASGTDHYTFQGEGLNGTVNDPTLYLTRGKTYRFENGSGGHPIRIQSTSGASGTAYNTGVTNNAGSGTVIVEVQHDAPDVLYYQCTSHANMNGILYITGALADGGVTTAKLAADAVNGTKIADNAVAAEHIAANAVGSSELADNAVDTAAIANDAVTAAKLANDAVISSNIVNGAVDSAKIADATIGLDKLVHGTSSNNGKFLRANNGADPTFETVNTDLVSDTSPQLGGDLDTNGHEISLDDGHFVKFGASNDMSIGHNTLNYITYTGASLQITGDSTNDIILKPRSNEISAQFSPNGAASLWYDNVKQIETTENGILLPKGCIRGTGGSKVILGGTINPSNDTTWNFSFSTNDNGYNTGFIFNIKFYMNHWNGGAYYKYIESISGGRGNTTGLERVDLINNVGGSNASWNNSHLDYSVSLSGGTRDGTGMSLFKVTYDADGAPAYTSGYYLEVNYSNQIGVISIT